MTKSQKKVEHQKVAVLVLLLVTGMILLFQSLKVTPDDEDISAILEDVAVEKKQDIGEILRLKKATKFQTLHFLASKSDLQKRIKKMQTKKTSYQLQEILESFYEGTQLLNQGRHDKSKLNLGRAIHRLDFCAVSIPTFETLYNLGYAYFEFGDYEQAFMEFQKALEYEKNHPGIYNGMGLSLVNLGQVEEGLDRLHIGLSIAGSNNNKAWKGEILNQLGKIYKQKSEDKIAQVYLQEAIVNNYAIGYMEGAVDSLCTYSEIKIERIKKSDSSKTSASDLGIKKVKDYLSRALNLAREINYHMGIAKSAATLATLHQARGETDKALDYYQKALAAYMNMENSFGQATTLNRIAQIYERKRDFGKALKYYQESLLLHKQINHQGGKSNDLGNIGMIYYLKGDLKSALKYYQGALVVHHETGNQKKKSITLGNIGTIYLNKQEMDKALVYLKNALIIDRRIGFKEGEALHLCHIGKTHLRGNNLEVARKSFEDSLELYRQIENVSGQARQLSNLAQYYLAAKDTSKSLKYHLDSLATFRQVGDIEGEASQMSKIGLLYREMGKTDDALKYLNKSLEIFASTNKQTNRKFASLEPSNLSRLMLIQN